MPAALNFETGRVETDPDNAFQAVRTTIAEEQSNVEKADEKSKKKAVTKARKHIRRALDKALDKEDNTTRRAVLCRTK